MPKTLVRTRKINNLRLEQLFMQPVLATLGWYGDAVPQGLKPAFLLRRLRQSGMNAPTYQSGPDTKTRFTLDYNAADAGKNEQREAANPGTERERLGKVKRDGDAARDKDCGQRNEHAHAVEKDKR